MSTLKLAVLSSIGAMSFNAFAGMDSGGGMIVKDANNPWFINNTSQVNYCIERDSHHFPITDGRINSLIKKGISYWRGELSRAVFNPAPNPNGPLGPKFEVLPSSWTFQDTCKDDTDIRFQFGVLNENQKKHLDDPKEYLGAAVRTNYDRKNMKGKGFIYISPETGPLKFNGPEIHPTPWQLGENNLLYATLTHELGHVLGIADDSSSYLDLMSERYLEIMLNKDGAESLEQGIGTIGLPNYVKFNNSKWGQGFSTCGGDDLLVREFFAVPEHTRCFSQEIVENVLKLKVAATGEDDWTALGEVKLAEQTRGNKLLPFITVWLPKEQIVYDTSDRGGRIQIAGFRYQQSAFNGSYKSSDFSLERPVTVHVSPFGNIKINGYMNGEIFENLWK